MRKRITYILAGALVAAWICWYYVNEMHIAATPLGSGVKAISPKVTLPDGLQYEELKIGTGPVPKTGQYCTVNYTGWLENGTVFDSSAKQGAPLGFILGIAGAIRGWDEGISTMKVGGKRRIIIPPILGYGVEEHPPIPANSTLIFEVELLKAE